MPTDAPHRFTDPDAIAGAVIDRVGRDIVLGLPLGIGKANAVANALFRRAAGDQTIRLRILTALTLERPRGGSDLARRFLGPLSERLFDGYEDLDYAAALRGDGLPPNVDVSEFYLAPGAWLGAEVAQRAYISANYTEITGLLLEAGVNVIAQLVATDGRGDAQRFSLASNTDIALDLLPELERQKAAGRPVALVAETNDQLPWMPGPAEWAPARFDFVLDPPGGGTRLFGPPKQPVSLADHAAGIHAASLVPDGGTLQIGIGALGDAVVHALILRQNQPDVFRDLLARLGADPAARETGPFRAGLYGVTEMFVDGFLALHRAGILTRRVRDHDGDAGAVLHAAFLMGPEPFYRALGDLDAGTRAAFRMMPVSFTNSLLGDTALKRGHRRDARFINIAMMATLLGAAVSDALEDGRVVSGVGGQHDFQTQARALDGARAVLMLNATRTRRGRERSNIVWSYGHTTIPRHLRDTVVTEYGVGDLARLSDRDTIAATLAIADSRFQDRLLRQARDAGKIERGFRLPSSARRNRPAYIRTALGPAREAGALPAFPFASGLTDAEEGLARALDHLRGQGRLAAMAGALTSALAEALTGRRASRDEADLLARMDLDPPRTLRERGLRALLLHGLRRSGAVDADGTRGRTDR